MKRAATDNEGPQHKVTIARPFAVSKFDVTFADWDACVSVGGCPRRSATAAWDGAQSRSSTSVGTTPRQYVAWLSRMTGQPYRLLTEAEWEYAARAGTTTAYSWGDEIGKGTPIAMAAAASGTTGRPHRSDRSSPMRSASTTWPAMCGNGCRIAITTTTTERPPMVRRGPAGDCSRRVVRGGSWDNDPQVLRSASRFGFSTVVRNDDLGFRVGRTLTLESLPLYLLGPGRSPGRIF